MIEQLTITNVALIDSMELAFHSGLNILTGETGAGKSIIIDSINFALGGKADKNFIRNGADSAVVELVMYISNDANRKIISEKDITLDDDHLIIISRTIHIQGKSSIKINGRTISLSMLKEITELLCDLHGQHEHQSLLNQLRHLELLDRFCSNELDSFKQQLSEQVKLYKEKVKTINALIGSEKDISVKKDMLTFQISEIETLKLSIGEEERLIERRQILSHAAKIAANLQAALELLYEDDHAQAAYDRVAKAGKYISELIDIDPSLAAIVSNIDNALSLLDDSVRVLRKNLVSVDQDPNELNDIEERLDVIYRIKKKYCPAGAAVADILEFLAQSKEKLDLLENNAETVKKLNNEKKKQEAEIILYCEQISSLRKIAAENIKNSIEASLKDLGMKNVIFGVNIERKAELSQNGFDKVEFMISPNLGEPLKSLAKIASGGEMSRIMLAMKNVLADADTVETFIFDEIDSGVSGRTAQQVAEKLSSLSQKHQILCITHLPQIAAMSDSHKLIEKRTIGEKTIIKVADLDNQQSIVELSRLIGGAVITNATQAAASEMKEQAKELKTRASQD